MPCFLGFRTRETSDRDVASSLPAPVMSFASVVETRPDGCKLASCGSSSLVSLSALLRKTLRRLFARKLGPSALSAMLMRSVQTVVRFSSVSRWYWSRGLDGSSHRPISAWQSIRRIPLCATSPFPTSQQFTPTFNVPYIITHHCRWHLSA
jgi:hypothetical protein